tara:strand:- start:72141 stop:72335 length:195 start_codon:yes stop_codon:yes gene_type:complete
MKEVWKILVLQEDSSDYDPYQETTMNVKTISLDFVSEDAAIEYLMFKHGDSWSYYQIIKTYSLG